MSAAIVCLLAVSTGCIVANVYYAQPLLADIAREFGLSVDKIGAVAMLTQIGMATGMLVFVPLGDKYERRALISTLVAVASVALMFTASARSVLWLCLAGFAVGASSATVHIIVPLAAHLAPAERRGQVVGSVLSGLLIGVLLARTFSGVFGARYGWRTVYWIAAAVMACLSVLTRTTLPVSRPDVSLRWTDLMRSVVSLAREQKGLRDAAFVSSTLFLSFSALWTTLVFLLQAPPYHYGSAAAGLFGLLGASSAIAAPLIGKFSDRRGPERAVLTAIVLTLVGYLILLLAGHHLLGLILAIVAIDVGVQSGHVANQSRIYSLVPSARSRLNTFYMVAFLAGGAMGSYTGTLGWKLWGRAGFCAFPIAAVVCALGYFLRTQTTPLPEALTVGHMQPRPFDPSTGSGSP